MHTLRPTLLLATALALSVPAAAQHLMLGGPDTAIHRGDPALGGFQIVGACGGIVGSMTALGDTTYIGDVSGTIYEHTEALGVRYLFDAGNDATALATHGGDLLVAGTDGIVRRLALPGGAALATHVAPVPIHAMVRHGNELFVGSHFGVVYRMNLATGTPFQFFGTCGGPIDAMTTDATALVLGTTSGAVYRIGLVTQQIQGSYSLGTSLTGLGMNLGHLVAVDAAGRVRRADPVTGAVLLQFAIGHPVSALALTEGNAPGSTYCYGLACPCGNNDPSHGCANSLGRGAFLQATGTASVTRDDLGLLVTSVPASTFGIFYMGLGGGTSTVGDGIFCTASAGGYGNYRFPVIQATPGGALTMTGVAAHAHQSFDPLGQIHAGSSWQFQVWYRDPMGPCGHAFNTSNGYQVTFTP